MSDAFCSNLPCFVFVVFIDASTHNILKKITAIVGETVILPCNITLSDDLPTIEWSKDDLSPNIIFLYRDGCETFEMKHPDFRFRTNLLMTELKHGNLSLRISNLQPSDEGRYQCMVLQKKQRMVELQLINKTFSDIHVENTGFLCFFLFVCLFVF
uniref:Ig-like domain-containing protein n=1 Tax=Acanthochromis polyacanthus TaxID=80966 RepID=A0A3Q1GTQ1_9TELE